LLPSPLPERGLNLSVAESSRPAVVLPATAQAMGLTAKLVLGCGS
jgi:hypothetical protein